MYILSLLRLRSPSQVNRVVRSVELILLTASRDRRAKHKSTPTFSSSGWDISFAAKVFHSDLRGLAIRFFKQDDIYFLTSLNRIELVVEVSNTYFAKSKR